MNEVYKKPNLKGPRARYHNESVMSYDSFKRFQNEYPEHSNMTLVEFNKTIKVFNKHIKNEVCENKDGVRLPERLGLFQIVAFPRPKKKVVDYGTSNKTGVRCYHGNWETDNKISKLIYQNTLRGYSFKNCRFWGVLPARSFKLSVSEAFKKFYSKYLYIDNRVKKIEA